MITLKSFRFATDDHIMSPIARTCFPLQTELPRATCLNPWFSIGVISHSPERTPHPMCKCGYHSVFPPQPFDIGDRYVRIFVRSKTMLVDNTRCLTVVQPHGTVIEHEYGVRSEYITILAIICSVTTAPLYSPDHKSHSKFSEYAHRFTTLANALSVPILITPQQINQFVNNRLERSIP